jgi:hypothetical protein
VVLLSSAYGDYDSLNNGIKKANWLEEMINSIYPGRDIVIFYFYFRFLLGLEGPYMKLLQRQVCASFWSPKIEAQKSRCALCLFWDDGTPSC